MAQRLHLRLRLSERKTSLIIWGGLQNMRKTAIEPPVLGALRYTVYLVRFVTLRSLIIWGGLQNMGKTEIDPPKLLET